MNRMLLLLTCFAGLLAGAASAQEVQPYAATIAADDTPVHSGPGRNYYVTGRLRRGAEVEVYRHDQGGWLAIRPPEGSFSLVGVRYLRRESDTLATVRDDQVGARIGSLESPDRDVVQVRLARGEQVELLEAEPVTSPNSNQSWYMIAPPAGEFRWIHESRIAGGARAIAEPSRPRPLPQVSAEPSTDPPIGEQIAVHEEPVEETSTTRSRGTKLATFQIESGAPTAQHQDSAGEEGWTAAERVQPPRTRSSAAPQRRPEERAAAPAEPPARPSRGGSLRAELDAIELSLSQMVALDSSQWEFADINRRAEKLLNQSATAVERGRSRMLLRKIARFEEIARGHASVRASGMQSSRPVAPLEPLPNVDELRNESLAASRPSERSARPYRERQDADAVGIGRLTQVVSRRPGAPTFALIDENRQVRYFVTPSAGINLRSYVGKQVSISGVTSYNSSLRKQELTAERVDVLSDSILRR